MTFESDYDAVLTVKARRDRLDAAIAAMAADSEFTPLVHRLGCLRGICTLTGFALAVEIGDWHRFTGNTIGSFVGLVPSRVLLRRSPGSRARSPRPATPTSAGCWSRPPGTTAPATGSARPCATGGSWPHRPPEPAATPATGDCTHRWVTLQRPPQAATWSPTSPSPASSPAGAGPWPSSRTNRHPDLLRRPRPVAAARGATRDTAMSNRPHRPATLDPRHAVQLLPNSPSCGNQPAHISLTARRQRHAQPPTTIDEARGARPEQSGTGASPCPLTGSHYISALGFPAGDQFPEDLAGGG